MCNKKGLFQAEGVSLQVVYVPPCGRTSHTNHSFKGNSNGARQKALLVNNPGSDFPLLLLVQSHNSEVRVILYWGFYCLVSLKDLQDTEWDTTACWLWPLPTQQL